MGGWCGRKAIVPLGIVGGNLTEAAVKAPSEDVRSVERNAGIDFGRVVAFAAVVVIHNGIFRHTQFEVAVAVNQLGRFAVPFFFIASGYFYGLNPRSTVETVRYCIVRIAPIFLFWMLLYDPKALLISGPASLIALMNGGSGPGGHLWFLPALGIALTLTAFVLRFAGILWLVPLALAAYTLGLVGGSYREAFTPVSGLIGDTRNGLFFGFPCVVAGVVIARMSLPPMSRSGLTIAVALLAILQVSEFLALTSLIGYPSEKDFVVATLPFAIAVFILARSTKVFGSQNIANLGTVALGAYALHVGILKWLRVLINPDTLYLTLCVTGAAIVMSLTIAYLLAKLPLVARFVR